MLNGASCLAWVMNLIGESDADALLACVEERYRRPSRVIFLPYLTGERTPHNNPDARGAFFGLDATTEKLDLVQAVLEGVAFSLKDAQQCLAEAGCRHSDPGFIGGGARSALWGRIIANVLGRPIVRYEGARFGPALGAARLAMIAATGATVAEVGRPPERGTTVVPDDAVADEYRERHQTFRSLYRSAEELF